MKSSPQVSIAILAALSQASAQFGLASNTPPQTQTEPTKSAIDHLVLAGDFTVEGVMNDEPVKLIVEPVAPDRPVLNPEFVRMHGLSGSFITGSFNFGAMKLKAHTKVLKYEFSGQKWKRRSLWTDRPYSEEHAGAVGVQGIPHKKITFHLRPSQGDEQRFVFPLAKNGQSFDKEIGGKQVEIGFTLRRDHTLASAAAGSVLAEEFGGTFSPERFKQEIAFGVERPIQRLQLQESFFFAGRSLGQIYVRTRDWGDVSGIKKHEKVEGDPSEIVVAAKAKKGGKARYSITIGRDDLAHCSTMTFDKKSEEIILYCSA